MILTLYTLIFSQLRSTRLPPPNCHRKRIKHHHATFMSVTADDFCTGMKEINNRSQCGCIRDFRLSQCASLTASLIKLCLQMPVQDLNIIEFLKSIRLETCCSRSGDVYSCYINYNKMPDHTKSSKLCSAMWKRMNPDKESPDTCFERHKLLIKDCQKCVNLIKNRDSGCTYIAKMIEIINTLTKFVYTYHQYLTRPDRPDIRTLLDRLTSLVTDEHPRNMPRI
jgi:hypothetical protein